MPRNRDKNPGRGKRNRNTQENEDNSSNSSPKRSRTDAAVGMEAASAQQPQQTNQGRFKNKKSNATKRINNSKNATEIKSSSVKQNETVNSENGENNNAQPESVNNNQGKCKRYDTRRVVKDKSLKLKLPKRLVDALSYADQDTMSDSEEHFEAIDNQANDPQNSEIDGIDVSINASEDDFGTDSEDELDEAGPTQQEEQPSDPPRAEERFETVTTPISTSRMSQINPRYWDFQMPSVNSEVQFKIHRRPAIQETPTTTTAPRDESGPVLQHMMDQLVNERVRRQLAEERCKAMEEAAAAAKGPVANSPKETTPARKEGKSSKGVDHDNNNVEITKSPSDTTIYMPALAKERNSIEAASVIDKISDFVESIRFGSDKGKAPKERATQKQQEKTTADQLIIEAEKYKANVAAPKGEFEARFWDNFGSEMEFKRFFDNDDDFFHVSCHIEQSLKGKIEQGEFVDLEKLLPRQRGRSSMGDHGDRIPVDLVSKEGHTYLAPGQQNDNRISSIRKWEQAFRVYAAIYSAANPSRSAEIWQYIHTINVAATTHHWDNVSLYDVTFRQLMAAKPWRSWGKNVHTGVEYRTPRWVHGKQWPRI